MTCLSTLRGTWPFSICAREESDGEEWPPPWPRIGDNSKEGYARTRQMTIERPVFDITNPISPATPQEKSMRRIKTSNDRLPPVPKLPEKYYGLPANSVVRSASDDIAKRGRPRNKLVKSRTQSMSRSRSRPAISVPSDFRKVAGATSSLPRVEPSVRRRDSWRRVIRRQSRRVSFQPLQLSIYEPGNELKPLPRFSRLILDPSRKSFLMEAASRPVSEMPRMPVSRYSLPRGRSTRSGKTSRSPSKRATTPRVPFSQSFDDASSDISFDDLESVVDPVFNPAPVKRRSRGQSMKTNIKATLEPVRPPPPLKTRSLLPSPRDDKHFVSPQSPAAQRVISQPLRLDDLPSAFSSPASPHPSISWPVPPGQRTTSSGKDMESPVDPVAPVAFAQIRVERKATPDEVAQAEPGFPLPPQETNTLQRHSPTPSNGSSVNTAMTANSYSAQSSSTAATAPPTPPQRKYSVTELGQPIARPFSKRPVAPAAPASVFLREITVQRVAAETPLMQPIPLVPSKSPKRFMPHVYEDPMAYTHTAFMYPTEPAIEQPRATVADPNRLTQWPSTMQTAYASYQQQQQQQLQQMGQLDMLKQEAQPIAPPRWQTYNATSSTPKAFGPKAEGPQRPQLHLETSQSQSPVAPAQQAVQASQAQTQSGWTQTGSAWREVVFSLKRRTQEEAALQMREQQVIIDAVSAHSDISEASQAPWAQKQRRIQHTRGGSGDNGSGASYSSYSSGTLSRTSSANSASATVMEVPVALSLGPTDTSRELGLSAEASNAALLQMQPIVRHDMTMIAEESEEEDAIPRRAAPAIKYNTRTTTTRTTAYQAPTTQKPSGPYVADSSAPTPFHPPQKTLGVVNGMPEAETSDSESDSDSSDDDYESDDSMHGEWEIVHTAPASARQSLARHGSALVPQSAPAQPRGRQSGAAPASARSSTYSVVSNGQRASQMPMQEQRRSRSVPRDGAQRSDDAEQRGRSRSTSSSRSASSRGSIFIPAGVDLSAYAVPPMPPVPAQVPVPVREQQRALQSRPQPSASSSQWGRGLGSEFGVAY